MLRGYHGPWQSCSPGEAYQFFSEGFQRKRGEPQEPPYVGALQTKTKWLSLSGLLFTTKTETEVV